jgi:hypothetical protein
MKKTLLLLVAILLTAVSQAQNEQDFAARYMQLYAEGTSLVCTTVSPTMMEKLLQLPAEEEADEEAKSVLAQLKSIRVVTDTAANETSLLFEKAELLVQENSDRYKPLFEQEDKNVYVRRRGDYIVELVYFAKEEEGALQIVNLTGYMDENFIARLLKI